MEIGPALPPSFRKADEQSSSSLECEDAAFGPTLPPGFSDRKAADDASEYGPVLPATKPSRKNIVGPTLPPSGYKHPSFNSDSSEDELIGPSIHLAAPANAQYDAAEEFAARNRSLEAERKRKENEVNKDLGGREEWMTSLPTISLAQDIGLTARTFRNKAAPQQDSSWTKAPSDKQDDDRKEAVKQPEKRRYENIAGSRRDKEIADKLSKFNDSERQESLYDMHQKKLKKEMKKSKAKGEKAQRVPFSRETDLEVNKFDEAQRKSVLKKAALLDTRFGHGSQKYE
ncbi:GPALPP motifs-containing protein 1-like [Watersipora subatra]|uniref:GPALPP motifs-containing protein 1-like n=1 Tax=Watersipora subatra TaxID=2589382 RepID=UPI00355C9208